MLDLIGACALFVASIGRILPVLRDHQFSEDERAAAARNVARVRATVDWLEAAIESGNVSLDESLAGCCAASDTMPSRGLAANVCGEQVRLALLEARPAGLTAKQLVAATGLSLYQVRKGILYIREVAALANLTPLIWTYAGGYAFASTPVDWIA